MVLPMVGIMVLMGLVRHHVQQLLDSSQPADKEELKVGDDQSLCGVYRRRPPPPPSLPLTTTATTTTTITTLNNSTRHRTSRR